MAVVKNISNRHIVDQIGEHRALRDEHDAEQMKLRDKARKRPNDLLGDDYYAFDASMTAKRFDRALAEKKFGKAAVAKCYVEKTTTAFYTYRYGEGPKKNLRPPRATPVKRSGLFD